MLRTLLTSMAVAVGFVAPVLAHEYNYTAVLTGTAESHANGSPALGTAQVMLDLDSIVMHLDVSFSGLVGTVTSANIYAATPGPLAGTAIAALQTPNPSVPMLPGFPLGGASGTYNQTIDLADASSYDPAFLTAHGPMLIGALNALTHGIDDDRAYLSIETTAYPGGEIRGFLVLPGDFHLDHVVDAADYTVWRDRLGQTGAGLAADHNSDNIVDAQDYMLWQENFGRINPVSEEGSGSAAAVPEPASFVLLGIAWVVLLLSRRRR